MQHAAVQADVGQQAIVQLAQGQVCRAADVPALEGLDQAFEDGAARRGGLDDPHIIGNFDTGGAGDAACKNIQHG